ncbi:MBL fold metallo-hydrolase [Comamonas testosteroni]|uniref:Hydroxyacylglutathione hydrolase n=1 Tax=Comamonas testosteroni TaxID=285 RepID=A0A8B4S3A6_COMTE|nr:MBL fold metallo-hydrolase [Comamonas testosteroni]EHN65656.1 beta-lactamase [Comamonas testosteroni ATCC 11996]QQN68422.1 MBL fold metallo-hydrolase [Comamonas testosteroni]SUY78317.1 hydroxyacylglutathione hydrolase [Comamonas testosteroni]
MTHLIDTAQTDIQRHQFGRVTVFRGAKGGKYPDGNQIMIRGSDTLAALDTPIVANHIGAEFDAAELVVMGHVHEDHMAGLHRLPDAQVFAHAGDLVALQSWEGLVATFGWADSAQADIMRSKLESEFFYAPRPEARGYEDGAVWKLGQSQIRAIHMPGHTTGHSVLLIEPEGVAFIGDIDLTGFGPYYGDACSCLADFRRSLERLPEIDARIWVTSHHKGIYTERETFLRDLRRFAAVIDERGARILEWLAQRPLTLSQMVEQRLLYPQGFDAPWVLGAEKRSISQHLDELLAAGEILQERNVRGEDLYLRA